MPNIKTKRLFVALNLPLEIKEQLEPLTRQLELDFPGVKIVKTALMHITLNFIGDANMSAVEKITGVLSGLAGKYRKFEFEAGNIGCFPDERHPRVVYLANRQINGRLAAELQKKISEKLSQLGYRSDRKKWTSHITLGRVKYDINVPLDTAKLEKSINQPLRFTINSFDLMESELRPEGPFYTVVRKFRL